MPTGLCCHVIQAMNALCFGLCEALSGAVSSNCSDGELGTCSPSYLGTWLRKSETLCEDVILQHDVYMKERFSKIEHSIESLEDFMY